MKYLTHKILRNSIVWVFLLTVLSINAQHQKDTLNKERKFFFGGGIQVSVGNNFTTLGIAPSAIYKIADKWSAGSGLGYLYVKNSYSDYTSHVFNTSLLTLYNPVKGLQLSLNYEHYFIKQKFIDNEGTYNYPSLFIGAGYQVGRHGSIGIQYDVLYDEEKSIYNSPLIPYVRIYF